MHKSTRTGLIGLAILVFVVVIILLLNLESIKPSEPQPCVKLDGYETCHSSDPSAYRYYGTKTSYHIAIENRTDTDLPVEGCTPVVFYLFSRHATRYPDKEYIEGMIKLLPTLKEKIINNTISGKAGLCQEDLESLKKWKLNMKLDDDNRLSKTGEDEAEDLAHRYKEKFPSLLDKKYSPEEFTVEYTSRERTKVTAESFARGLFGDDSTKVEGNINDAVLTFHKSCKKLRKKCEDPSYDTSEIEKFKNGVLMTKVVDSVSKRIGVTLTSGDVNLIYTACVFGFALKDNDAWCSLLSTDDLEVLEFYSDIDDYYKDSYGNKVNYEQACPIAKYIFDLFKSVENTNETKVVLHFSHAGAIKKVYSLFGLYRDELPLTADAFCSERNRKWRSSYIVPFNSNIAFVLYQCVGDMYRKYVVVCLSQEQRKKRSTKLSKVFVVVIILLLNLESIKSSDPQSCVKLDGYETCHSTDPFAYRYYGTKTSYHIAIENQTDTDLPVEDCKPVVFYLFSRHATRYPGKDYIKDMIKHLPALKEKIIRNSLIGKAGLCQEDLESLKKWKLSMKPEDHKRLSKTGEVEAEELAHRYKEKFPSLLDSKYSPEQFTIEYTSKERTKDTAESFAKGLFGDDSKKIEAKINDEVLTFHKSCKQLRGKCEDPTYDISQVEKFKNGELMSKVVDSVSKRIGVILTSEDITSIYTACMFGFALKDSDAWCSLLSPDDLEVLEFNSDIEDYYKNSYGNKINYEQACPIAKYIFDLFKSVENTNETKVVLHFSHSGAIKKVYSLFGLYRDELPLKADAFCSTRNRKWRSSHIVPFNSNIAFVLYQCGKEYKVGAFHNEKAVKVNGCDHELCSFEKFSATYGPISSKCNISEICCTCCSNT
ncbi:multiple inositol polyphosphate phosphatase 1 [Nephila pilipes]|uniref:Multiple inositol polyphosphate phosphatase 1 n=1 Tax=Nephila pilipes TaxID=299642 RepID=A0A8X6M6X9_NEPPI|nr:multiple inositol polyphosphate phosphatase 1 [Nephila pilipes]